MRRGIRCSRDSIKFEKQAKNGQNVSRLSGSTMFRYRAQPLHF